MDADHLRAFVVRAALLRLGLHSAAAETLLVGTGTVAGFLKAYSGYATRRRA